MIDARRRRLRELAILGGILGLAAFLRVANLRAFALHDPIHHIPVVDAAQYVDDARYLLRHGLLGRPWPYFHPPLYTYFLALCLSLLGNSLEALRLLHALLDVANVYLVYRLVREVFGRAPGLLAGFVHAASALSIRYSIELLPPVLIVFLLLACTLTFLRGVEGSRPPGSRFRHLCASGLALGLAIVTLPNFLLWLAPLGAAVVLAARGEGRARIALRLGAFLLLGLAPTAAVAARNRLWAHDRVLISRNGGLNLYIGNNPDARDTILTAPGMQWDRLFMRAYQERRITRFADADRYYYDQVARWIRDDPLAWAQLLARKAVVFFTAADYTRIHDLDLAFVARHSWVLRLPLVPLPAAMGLALAALPYLLLERRRCPEARRAALLAALAGAYSASIILFFAATRYRLPLLPFLAGFASWLATELASRWRAGERTRALGYALLGCLAVLHCRTTYFAGTFRPGIHPVEAAAIVGGGLASAQRCEEAQAVFREGLGQGPPVRGSDELYQRIAHCEMRLGRVDEAVATYRKAVELNPDNYEAWNSLGFLHKRAGRCGEAQVFLRRAMAVAPCYAVAYLNLSDCDLRRGSPADAIGTLESFARRCPSPHPQIASRLGEVRLAADGRCDLAIRHLEEAIAFPQGIDPSPRTYELLATCYRRLGRPAEAGELRRRAPPG